MPKVTIKSLQAKIDELRELRSNENAQAEWQRIEIARLKEDKERMKTIMDGLDTDKRWLKTLVQSLSLPQQERTRF